MSESKSFLKWILAGGVLVLVGLGVLLLVQGGGEGVSDEPFVEPEPITPPPELVRAPTPAPGVAPAPAPAPAAPQPKRLAGRIPSFGEIMREKLKNVDLSKLPKVENPYAKIKDPKERAMAIVTDENKMMTEKLALMRKKLEENEKLQALSEKDVARIKKRIDTMQKVRGIVRWRIKNLKAGVWPEPPMEEYPGPMPNP